MKSERLFNANGVSSACHGSNDFDTFCFADLNQHQTNHHHSPHIFPPRRHFLRVQKVRYQDWPFPQSLDANRQDLFQSRRRARRRPGHPGPRCDPHRRTRHSRGRMASSLSRVVNPGRAVILMSPSSNLQDIVCSNCTALLGLRCIRTPVNHVLDEYAAREKRILKLALAHLLFPGTRSCCGFSRLSCLVTMDRKSSLPSSEP